MAEINNQRKFVFSYISVMFDKNHWDIYGVSLMILRSHYLVLGKIANHQRQASTSIIWTFHYAN